MNHNFECMDKNELYDIDGGVTVIALIVAAACCCGVGMVFGAGIHVGYEQAAEAHQ